MTTPRDAGRPPSPGWPALLLALLALSLGAMLALTPGAGRAAHPTGAVDAAAARKAGIAAGVAEVGCLDCHSAHGARPADMLTAFSATSACLSCHTRLGAQVGASHPWGVRVDGTAARATEARGFQLGAQDTVACLSCHTAHADRSSQEGCATCHRAQGAELALSSGEGHTGVACLECHAVHPGVGDSARRKPSAGDPAGCLSCHAPGRPAAVAAVSPGRLGHPVGGARTPAGDELGCGSCHEAHAPQRSPGGGCADCHADQHAASTRGGHGGLACEACHPVHARSPMDSPAVSGLPVNVRSRACLSCHGETVGQGEATRVAEFEHPAPVFDLQGRRWTPLAGLPLYDARGELLTTGSNGDLVCSSCHLTHGPESDKTRDNLRRGGWEDACAACHGDDALPLYRYFHQPERRGEVTAPGR